MEPHFSAVVIAASGIATGIRRTAWWPNLIIMFELTMLGAITATVITLIVTAGLGRGGKLRSD